VGFREDNQKERMKFVDFWSKYVLEHDDRVWSRQQNVIINSALKAADMSREQYLRLKGEYRPHGKPKAKGRK
jgi:hypothetical protein